MHLGKPVSRQVVAVATCAHRPLTVKKDSIARRDVALSRGTWRGKEQVTDFGLEQNGC